MPKSAARIGHRDTVSATERAWGHTVMQYRETSSPASRLAWRMRVIARRPARTLGALALTAMLAACVDGDRGRDRDRDRDDGSVFGGGLGGLLGQRVSYRCDDDRRFTASFQPFGQGISVDTGRRTYDLERRGGDRDRDRQEYRSRDGDVRLLVDGDEAELSIDGDDDFEDCERR
jgi:hypothetical protein